MSRVVNCLQRTYFDILCISSLLHIVLWRQIQTALGDLQRVDEKSIVELGDSGERLSIFYAYNVVVVYTLPSTSLDSLCPICLTPYNVILTEEELALAMDSPAHPIEELGIAKLAQSWQCGHLFCRRELVPPRGACCLPHNWNSLEQYHKMDYKWCRYTYILDHVAS